jgi:hypothetical protein
VYLLSGDYALMTQKIEQLSQRSGITLANPQPPGAISKVLGTMPS